MGPPRACPHLGAFAKQMCRINRDHHCEILLKGLPLLGASLGRSWAASGVPRQPPRAAGSPRLDDMPMAQA